MIDNKVKQIRAFCTQNANPDIVKKYSKYFKEGFDGFGIDQKTFEKQRDIWVAEWKGHMNLDTYLELADRLMGEGRFEEKSFAIQFIATERENYTSSTFNRIGKWFNLGIDNWATTDVLCMLVLHHFITDGVITLKKLKEWTVASSQWQRRAVPVTLVELIGKGLTPDDAFTTIEPLMLDTSEYVQKGIGTLLRGLWKLHPKPVEDFLLSWKDQCGRLIVQYATEKMDKEERKRFRRGKVS